MLPDAANLNLPLTLLDAALRGTLLALLALLGHALGRDRPRLASARCGTLLMAGLAVQVLASTPWLEATLPRAVQAPLVAIQVGNAVLFWLFVRALFDDDFRLRPRHALPWAACAGLAGWNCLMLPGSASVPAPLLMGLQRALPLLFALLCVRAALDHWRDDLVEPRRRLRLFILVGGIVYSLVQLGLRLQSERGRLGPAAALLDMGLLLALAGTMATRMLALARSELFPQPAVQPAAPLPPLPAPAPWLAPSPPAAAAAPAEALARAAAIAPGAAAAVPRPAPDPEPAPEPAPDPAEDRLAAALHRLMHEERHYRSEDLSIARLADHLGVPEYRLRRLINQRLGHRNFNAFINGYRLAEVRAALADPAQREVPVLTLALDAGFQSIGPFNRAFKALTGLTPTEFRRQALADS